MIGEVPQPNEEEGRGKNWPTPTGLTRSAPKPLRARVTLWIVAALAVVVVVTAVVLLGS